MLFAGVCAGKQLSVVSGTELIIGEKVLDSPEGVIKQLAELSCANVECEWSRRKHKMEKASRRFWTRVENSSRTMQLREYTMREFWKSSWMTSNSAATRVSGTQMFNLKPYSPKQ